MAAAAATPAWTLGVRPVVSDLIATLVDAAGLIIDFMIADPTLLQLAGL